MRSIVPLSLSHPADGLGTSHWQGRFYKQTGLMKTIEYSHMDFLQTATDLFIFQQETLPVHIKGHHDGMQRRRSPGGPELEEGPRGQLHYISLHQRQFHESRLEICSGHSNDTLRTPCQGPCTISLLRP